MRPWLIWIVPLATCASVLIFYLGSGVDFFLFSLLTLLPIPLVLFVGACVAAFLQRKGPPTSSVTAAISLAAAMILLQALLISGKPLRDFAHFHVWAIGHSSEALKAKHLSAVLSRWDGYGFAGNGNDDYLVSDPTEGLSGALMPRHVPVLPDVKFAVARRWSTLLHLLCDPVWVRRVHRGFYVVTTYDRELRPNTNL